MENNMADVTNGFIEQEKCAQQREHIEPKIKSIEADDLDTFLKCVNYHHGNTDIGTNAQPTVGRDNDDIDKYLPNGSDKPCLICTTKKQQQNVQIANGVEQTMKQLCETLCNDKCKMSTPAEAITTDQAADKMLMRSNSSRQEFLASMLQEATTLVQAPVAIAIEIDEFDKATDQIAEQTEAVVIDNLKEFDGNYYRDKLNVAEALAKTSMMTSPAASRRLAARKMEMNLNDADFVYDSENSDYIPPKELLMYLVR